MTGRRARAIAGLLLLVGAGACGPDPEPLFAATCGPDADNLQVACTIKNHGKKAGRACFRARVQPPEGVAIIARRVCTAVIEPGQSVTVSPPFERFGRGTGAELIGAQCAPAGQWTCKVDVVETSREMMENQPKGP